MTRFLPSRPYVILWASKAPGVWPAAQAQAASTCSLPGLQAEGWKWEPLPILSSQDGSGSPRRVTAVLVRASPEACQPGSLHRVPGTGQGSKSRAQLCRL